MNKKSSPEKSRKYLTDATPVKNLKFFVEFMRQLGLGMGDVAEAAHSGEAAVRHWFLKDTINLKKLMDVAEYYGYDLIISYDIPAPEIDRTNLTIEAPDRGYSSVDMSRRLSFIRAAMARAGVTVNQLVEKLGVTRDTAQRFFRADNISIDYIYRIAEAFDWKVNITFKKKPSANS